MKHRLMAIVILGLFLASGIQSTSAVTLQKDSRNSNIMKINENDQWTIMVYMAADNNIESFADFDLNAMKQAGSNDEVDIIALYDGTQNGDSKLYRILRSNHEVLNDSGEVIPGSNEVNMGNPNTLTNFIDWTVTNYPASHYCLILMGHGKFPKGQTQVSYMGFYKICRDDRSLDFLDVSGGELKQALNNVAGDINFDIIGFDGCLMGMLEVAYEVKDFADYMIAPEDHQYAFGYDSLGRIVIDDYGWDYSWLRTLVQNPSSYSSNVESLCKLIVDDYDDDDICGEASLSAIDLSKAGSLASEVSSLGNYILSKESEYVYEIRYAKKAAKVYGNYGPESGEYVKLFVDLYTFAEELERLVTDDSTIDSYANNIVNKVSQMVIADNNENDRSKGIAIYFADPGSGQGNNGDYRDFTFSDNTKWDDLINWMHSTYDSMYANFNAHKPNPPVVNGDSTAKIDEEFEITFSSNDPDDNKLCYEIIWNLEYPNGWVGPLGSGEQGASSHIYGKDDVGFEFDIIVRAYDCWDMFSTATHFTIKVSKARPKAFEFMPQLLLEHFPRLLEIINLFR